MRRLTILALIAACSSRKQEPPPAPNHLRVVYEIDLDKAVDDRSMTLRRDLQALFDDQKIRAEITVGTVGVTITPEDASRRAEIQTLVQSTYKDAIILRDCSSSARPGAICIALSVSHAVAIKKAALAAAVATVKSRIAATKLAPGAAVSSQADTIVVELPTLEPESLSNLRDAIARTGQLAFNVVDSNAEYMQRLYAHIGEPIPGADVTADVDQWRAESGGGMHVDYYLKAYDRETMVPLEEARRMGCMRGAPADGQALCRLTGRTVIEQYVRELATRDPSFKLPDDRELGFELVEPGPHAMDKRPYWRSYFLERPPALTGSAISNATSARDPNTSGHMVTLELTRDGGRAFGELTEKIVGKKLATILDGRIRSAPIINGTIRGGRASIFIGGNDERAAREASELALVLKTGALPAPLIESSVSELP